MLKYVVCFTLYALLWAGEVVAQMEASTWYFGVGCGLDFSKREPAVIGGGKTRARAGTAVISNRTTGELLFYTDGRNFWNRDHKVMQNAHTLPVNCYSQILQPAIILPSISNEHLYHVFCIRPSPEESPSSPLYDCTNFPVMDDLQDDESGLSLFYYLVDMRLDNGLGNVIEEESNLLVQSNVTEKLTAVPHTNGQGYWVLVHGWMNNTFYAHHFKDGRIAETVTTDIGSVHGAFGGIFFRDEVKGELKPSPDGKKIAAAVFSEDRPFDLFDFDAGTGKLSNYLNLGNISGQYGVSFSPDNSKLYVSSDSRITDRGSLDIILQFDLNEGSHSSIIGSAKSLIVGNTRTNLPSSGIIEGWSTVEKGMALALDGRLYVTGNDASQDIAQDDVLVIIDKPNEAGFECQINFRVFPFGEAKTSTGLPNFMQAYFNGLESTSVCTEESALSLYPNPTMDNIIINFKNGCHSSGTMKVLNALGQVVLTSMAISSQSTEVDLSNLSSGVYFLILNTTSHKTLIKRIVKL